MTKTLTYLVFLLTMSVSVSVFADFTSSGSGFRNGQMPTGVCASTYAEACSSIGGSLASCGNGCTYCVKNSQSVSHSSCTIPPPSNSTCTGSGSTRTCTCNTGYKENSSTSSSTSCDLTPEWSEILGIAIGLGIAAAGAAAAAAVCGTVAVVGCASAVATALFGAGIAATAIYNGSDPKPDPVKPTTMNITLAPQSADNTKPTGVHRDHQGNLTPTGTGWTQNGDKHTKTATDGTTTSTTSVNTKTDTAVHTITNSATGKTSKTVVSGSGGSGGGSGGGTASGGASTGAGIVTEDKNADGSSTTTTIKTDTDGNPTDVSVITCNVGGSCTVTTPTTGGSSGGGTGGSGGTGGTGGTGTGGTGGTGSGDGSLVCGSVNCEATQQNVLNELKSLNDKFKSDTAVPSFQAQGNSNLNSLISESGGMLKGSGQGKDGEGEGLSGGFGDGSGGGGVGGGCPTQSFQIPYLNVNIESDVFCQVMAYIEQPLNDYLRLFYKIVAFIFILMA